MRCGSGCSRRTEWRKGRAAGLVGRSRAIGERNRPEPIEIKHPASSKPPSPRSCQASRTEVDPMNLSPLVRFGELPSGRGGAVEIGEVGLSTEWPAVFSGGARTRSARWPDERHRIYRRHFSWRVTPRPRYMYGRGGSAGGEDPPVPGAEPDSGALVERSAVQRVVQALGCPDLGRLPAPVVHHVDPAPVGGGAGGAGGGPRQVVPATDGDRRQPGGRVPGEVAAEHGADAGHPARAGLDRSPSRDVHGGTGFTGDPAVS